MSRKNVFVRDHPGQLEIGDGDGTIGVVAGYEGARDISRKTVSPYDGGRGWNKGVIPNAAHADLACVTGANVRRGSGYEFLQACRACRDRVHKETKVGGGVAELPGEANAMVVGAAQRRLESGEETPRSRQGGRHRSKLA